VTKKYFDITEGLEEMESMCFLGRYTKLLGYKKQVCNIFRVITFCI